MVFSSGGTWQQLGFAVQFEAADAAQGMTVMSGKTWDMGRAVDALTKAEASNAKVVSEELTPATLGAAQATEEHTAAALEFDDAFDSTVKNARLAADAFLAEQKASHSAALALEEQAQAAEKVNKVTEERFKQGVSSYFSRAAGYAGARAGKALTSNFGQGTAATEGSAAVGAIVPALGASAAAMAAVAVSIGLIVAAVGAVVALFKKFFEAAREMQNALQGARMASLDYAKNMEQVKSSALAIQRSTGISTDEVGKLTAEFARLKVARTDIVRLGESMVEMSRALEMPVEQTVKLNDMFERVWSLGEKGARGVIGAVRVVADTMKTTASETVQFLETLTPLILRVRLGGGEAAAAKLTEQAAMVQGIFANAGLKPGEGGSLFARLLDPTSPEGRRTLGVLSSKMGKAFDDVRTKVLGGDLTDVMAGLTKLVSEVTPQNAELLGQLVGQSGDTMLLLRNHVDELKMWQVRGKELNKEEQKNVALREAAAREEATYDKQKAQALNKLGAWFADHGTVLLSVMTKFVEVLGSMVGGGPGKPGALDSAWYSMSGRDAYGRSKFDMQRATVESSMHARHTLPRGVTLDGKSRWEIADLGKQLGLPGFAHGGIVMPKPGGSQVTVAEAGQPEVIMPISKLDELFERHTRALVAAIREQTEALGRAMAGGRPMQAAPAYASRMQRNRETMRDALRGYGT